MKYAIDKVMTTKIVEHEMEVMSNKYALELSEEEIHFLDGVMHFAKKHGKFDPDFIRNRELAYERGVSLKRLENDYRTFHSLLFQKLPFGIRLKLSN